VYRNDGFVEFSVVVDAIARWMTQFLRPPRIMLETVGNFRWTPFRTI